MSDRPLSPAGFPEQIRFENTSVCNARCTMCPRELLTRKCGFAAPQLVEKIVDECRGHRIAKFTVQGFGEPLLDPHFASHVRLVKQQLGCPTFTVSNASCISPELAGAIVEAGLDKIKISFYGTSQREYEAVHRPLRYERTRASILNLIEAKRKAGSPLIIRIQYIGRLWKFVPFFLQWCTKARVGFNTLHNYGNGRRYNRVQGRKPRGCPMVRQPILQVLWTGQIVPCCYDFNGTMLLGDLREQTIEEVWGGAAYQAFRAAHRAGDLSGYPVCETCDKRF